MNKPRAPRLASIVLLIAALLADPGPVPAQFPSPADGPAAFSNPVYQAYVADPACLLHDGVYHVVGTGKIETVGTDKNYATDFCDSDATTFRGAALVVDRMKSMTELEGHPQTVMRAHWQWQVYEHNRPTGGVRADWYTLEAPSVAKHGGKYYCLYSGGNYQNDTYGVDYLVADGPLGPWTEAGQFRGPQIMRSVLGPEHNGLAKSPDGRQDYILYHAWNAAMTARQLWVDPLVWTEHGPQVERFAAPIQERSRQAEADPYAN